MSQSSFLIGRQLVDGVLVINKIIIYAKIMGWIIFDSINGFLEDLWLNGLIFLEYMLERFGFNHV